MYALAVVYYVIFTTIQGSRYYSLHLTKWGNEGSERLSDWLMSHSSLQGPSSPNTLLTSGLE